MRMQDPDVRVHNFDWVNLGYSPQEAAIEASRCIQCKKPTCIAGCPAEINIPKFILAVKEGDMEEAFRELKKTNSMPAICGRVCPQEIQCEKVCILGVKQEPVAIGALEYYVGDWAIERGLHLTDEFTPVITPDKEKVAIVGSGPGGLTAAVDLSKMGYDVTIFEALHAPGGVLNYGIPPFRLPRKTINAEIAAIQRMGVKIQLNTVVGKTVTLEQLRQRGFKAFLLATGAGLPLFMGIPGENACGVYSANEYLTRIILMGAWDFPNNDTPVFAGKKVVVVGAGNTAMDAMRSSRRLPWVEEVWCVYRRSRQEAPARIEELEHAEQEGVNFQFLTLPLQILMTEDHWVRGLRCQRMELGEPDEKGRRKPVPIEGSEFEIECDTVVYAIGQRPNPVMMRSIPGLEITKWGTVAVDDELKTNIEGVFAAGDIISGASTVIMAVGQGKRAARSIDRYLSGVRSGNPTWEPVYAEAVAVT